jgi:hypothetical protein
LIYIIDRFEEEYAVCEREDKTFENIRKLQLPKSVKEGDVIIRTEEGVFWIDKEATKKRKEIIRKKMDQLWE